MTKKSLYMIWAALFVLTAGLGFIQKPGGAGQVCCIVLAVSFFVPPAVLVYLGWKRNDRESLRLVRNLAFGSLLVTLLVLVANFMTLGAPVWVGDLLYAVMVIVTAPMVCGQAWVVSLLLWAALMWTCILLLGKKK